MSYSFKTWLWESQVIIPFGSIFKQWQCKSMFGNKLSHCNGRFWSSNLCWIAPSTDLCGNVGGAFVECSHSGRSLCSLCLRFHKPQVQRWCHFSMCDFSLRSPNLVAHSGYFSISKIVCGGWGGVCTCQKLQTLAWRLIQHHNSMHTLLYQTTATSTGICWSLCTVLARTRWAVTELELASNRPCI